MSFFEIIRCSILLFVMTFSCSVAAETQSNNHQEYGFSRQKMADQANSSDAKVEEKLMQLQNRINNSQYPGDVLHNAEIVRQLQIEYQQWLNYRDSHCRLNTYIYIYPVTSRLSNDEYNACKLTMNRARLRFLNDISYEFE